MTAKSEKGYIMNKQVFGILTSLAKRVEKRNDAM